MIFSRGRRGAESSQGPDGECAYKAMGTLTSYVGAIFVGRPLTKGSTGFCWININSVEATATAKGFIAYSALESYNDPVRRTRPIETSSAL